MFNPCCVTAQEGLLVRTPGNGKRREPPTKGLAVARAPSVAENAAEEGESSDDGIPNEHNNGSNDVNNELLQRGSTTNNGEGYDTSEDSSSEGELDNALQCPRTRQHENSGIEVTSRVTRPQKTFKVKRMVLLANSEIAATVMVHFRFSMGIHYAKNQNRLSYREISEKLSYPP